MSKTKKIVLAGLLLAASIILSRFISIKTPILVISFTYIPIMFSAILLGPKWSATIAGLADLIGAILFPFGTFFPGYTLSAILTGLIYGLLLHNKVSLKNLIISSVIVLLFIHTGLTSLWVNITSGKAILVFLPTRIISAIIMLPIQVATIYFLHKTLKKPIEEYLK